MDIQYKNRLKTIQHLVEEKGSINNLLYTNPLVCNDFDKDIKEVAEILLPFSIGIEIECFQKENFNLQDFTSIPNIMDVDIDKGEQRFRIPNGLNGLKCLYNISLMLYKNSQENFGSGIHYHIDCTSFFDKLTKDILTDNTNSIIKELEHWNYKGTYNTKGISFKTEHYWIRRQTCFKTLECRIGEMTFDYKILFQRIVHLSEIIKDLKYICEVKSDISSKYSKNIYKVLQNRTEKL